MQAAFKAILTSPNSHAQNNNDQHFRVPSQTATYHLFCHLLSVLSTLLASVFLLAFLPQPHSFWHKSLSNLSPGLYKNSIHFFDCFVRNLNANILVIEKLKNCISKAKLESWRLTIESFLPFIQVTDLYQSLLDGLNCHYLLFMCDEFMVLLLILFIFANFVRHYCM